VGDLIWAAADQRARGFLIGATAGRTTLGGEGLQHQDGSSHLVASTVPNCRAYDPAYAYEIAVIVERGSRRMMEEGAEEFYYVTAMNEAYAQPSMPTGVEDAIMKGMYRLRGPAGEADVRLLGSGAILPEVLKAAELLEKDWGVAVEAFSVTSYSELAREAREIERGRLLQPGSPNRPSHLETLLAGSAPVVAATDYVRAYPQLIVSYIAAPFVALGTDGFGRSDTRARLRSFFGVDRNHIVVATLGVLARQGRRTSADVAAAVAKYRLPVDAPPPWMC
jgi:pyruvate dehydrogenase E1 component